MGSTDDEDTDESLMKQVLNMVFENSAIMFCIASWGILNMLMLVLLIYIAVRTSIR
jgi:hypothetical protein